MKRVQFVLALTWNHDQWRNQLKYCQGLLWWYFCPLLNLNKWSLERKALVRQSLRRMKHHLGWRKCMTLSNPHPQFKFWSRLSRPLRYSCFQAVKMTTTFWLFHPFIKLSKTKQENLHFNSVESLFFRFSSTRNGSSAFTNYPDRL